MSSKTIKSTFPSLPFPENVSLLQHLAKTVTESNGDKICRIDPDSGVTYTVNQTIDHALRFRSALVSSELGLQRRSYIAICLPNVADYLSILTGVTEADMVAALLNPDYTEAELETMLRDIPIAAMVTLPSIADRLSNLTKTLGVQTVITVGKGPEGSVDYHDLLKRHEPLQLSSQPYDSSQTAYIIFSSGTTGAPKGVELSHRNVISMIGPSGNLLGGEDGLETLYLVFPPYHVAGVTILFVSLFRKWTLIASSSKFSVPNLITSLRKFQPTLLGLPPTVISIICSRDELQQEDFKQLKYIIYGSSTLGKTLAEKISAKVGPEVGTLGIYGLSEFTCFATMQPLETATSDNCSVGKVIPHSEMKIRCTSTGLDLGPNEDGEICLRGPSVFVGYINNAKAYRETVDPEGWLHTGDFGHYDSEGNLFITGRMKDLIKVNSYQVSPDEIENVIRKHDLVEEVVVFGVPDPKTQEAPRALIVAKSKTLHENDIHDFIKDKLVHYKQLRGGVRFVESIPVTPGARKLNRKAARAMDEAMGQGYSNGVPTS